MLGLLAAIGQELLNRRFRTKEAVQRYLNIPVLGTLPAARGKWNPHPQLFQGAPASSFSEAVRLMRTSVELTSENKSIKSLLVTSPKPNEGKTTVALNLARSIAMGKKKVLLIDMNLRKPDVSAWPGSESGPLEHLGLRADTREKGLEFEGVDKLLCNGLSLAGFRRSRGC